MCFSLHTHISPLLLYSLSYSSLTNMPGKMVYRVLRERILICGRRRRERERERGKEEGRWRGLEEPAEKPAEKRTLLTVEVVSKISSIAVLEERTANSYWPLTTQP